MKIQQSLPNLTQNLPQRGNQPQIQAQQPPDPQEKVNLSGDPRPPKSYGKILLKTAVSGGLGALLGAGMATGGVGGFIAGALAGSALGLSTIGPMGNGKGADGLVYVGAGLVIGGVAGALAGAAGLPHGALIGGATFGLLTLGKALA